MIGMDDDGLFFLESLRSEYVSPQPAFWAPTWGCCSTGELLPQMRSKGSKTGTVAASRASCYIRCGIGVPQLGLLQSHGRGQRLLNTSFYYLQPCTVTLYNSSGNPLSRLAARTRAVS